MLIIPVRLGERLRWYRLARGLGQTELAERTGMNNDRLSALERSFRRASLEEVDGLAAALRLRRERLLVGTDWSLDNRELLRKNRRGLELRFVGAALLGRDGYEVPRDREFRVRLRAVRRTWPDVLRGLEEDIEGRDDYDETRLFLRDVSCDSADEALVVLRSLAAAGQPALVATLHLGFDRHFIVDPRTRRGVGHCHVPGIILAFKRFECVLIPQVSLRIGEDVYTVDFLAGCRIGRNVDWAVLEMDGHGHRNAGDAERDAALSMPVIRFGPAAAASETFLATLEERLADAIHLDVPRAAA